MHHHEHDDNHDHQRLLVEGLIQRAQRLVDQRRAVVKRDDRHPAGRDPRGPAVGRVPLEKRHPRRLVPPAPHARLEAVLGGETADFILGHRPLVDNRLDRQRRGQFGDAALDFLDDLERIGAVSRYHHSADSLGAAAIQRAPAGLRAEGYFCHLSDQDGDAHVNLDHAVSQVFGALDESHAANDVLHAVDLDGLCAHVDVGVTDRPGEVFHRHPIGPHGVGVRVHLVFPHEPPHRRGLAYALRGSQLWSHLPVLDRAQLLQVPSAGGLALGIATFQRVPKYLPQPRGVGA